VVGHGSAFQVSTRSKKLLGWWFLASIRFGEGLQMGLQMRRRGKNRRAYCASALSVRRSSLQLSSWWWMWCYSTVRYLVLTGSYCTCSLIELGSDWFAFFQTSWFVTRDNILELNISLHVPIHWRLDSFLEPTFTFLKHSSTY
jgi:hypothetical protein